MEGLKINLSALNIKTVAPPKKYPRVKRWTKELLIERSIELHGPKYDYSKVNPGQIRAKDKMIVICKKCNIEFYPTIDAHIRGKTGCPGCAGNIPYTHITFVEKVKSIHGDMYDYSKVTRETYKGLEVHVPVKCNRCQNEWNCLPHGHIYGKTGCPECADNKQWTKEKLIKRGIELHGDIVDYSLINDDQYISAHIKLPLRCKVCGFIWETNIHSHITHKSGCHMCNGRKPWNLTRLLSECRMIYGDLYDYSMIREEDVTNSYCPIIIICKKCNRKWRTTVAYHTYSKNGCISCRKSYWTLQRFLEEAPKVHGDLFNYSLIKESDVKGANCKVNIICNKCGYIRLIKVRNHITLGHGCTLCHMPYLERTVYNMLKLLDNITITPQYVFGDILRKFDVHFVHPSIDRPVIIETDGEQHFQLVERFHKSESMFYHKRLVDIYKTYLAFANNCYIIRLDYSVTKSIEIIRQHINKALLFFQSSVEYNQKWAYFTNPERYAWIIDAFAIGQVPRENPVYVEPEDEIEDQIEEYTEC